MGRERRVVKVQTKKKAPPAPDFAGFINDVMQGKRSTRPGAESAGMAVVMELINLHLMGEGALAEALRNLVDALMDSSDPLRKDIPREAWLAIWPALNTLVHARKKALETLEKARCAHAARLAVEILEVTAAAATPSSTQPPEVTSHGEGREEEGRSEEGPADDAGAGVLRAGERGGQ